MRKYLLPIVAASIFFMAGCGFLFGTAEPVIGPDGKALVNDDGTPVLQYRDGVIAKAAKTIAPIADSIPYGSAGTGVLALIAAIGATVQTARARKKIAASDVVDLIDKAGGCIDDIKRDEDLGDLIGRISKDTKLGAMLQSAFDKNRAAKKKAKSA